MGVAATGIIEAHRMGTPHPARHWHPAPHPPEDHRVAAPAQAAAAYRSFVGPTENYDVVGALQFSMMTARGLRGHHCLLDVGCGSLRGGAAVHPLPVARAILRDRAPPVAARRWARARAGPRDRPRQATDVQRRGRFPAHVFGRRFDYTLARSIFSHAARWQIERCLSEASEVLRPGGVVAATFVRGDDDHTGTEWVNPGMGRYRLETMEELAKGAGFQLSLLEDIHPDGRTWVQLRHPDRP